MSSRARASILQNFDVEVSRLIADSRGVSEMDGFRLFLDSEIHQMLEDNELKMWHFSPIAIFDMWENEVATGNPRNSLYLRGDEIE